MVELPVTGPSCREPLQPSAGAADGDGAGRAGEEGGGAEDSEGAPCGLEPELRSTFFFMERRRLQRQTSGRFMARGIMAAFLDIAMFLSLGVYGWAFIRQGLVVPARGSLYLVVPLLLTGAVVGASFYQSYLAPENLPAVWAKTWAWLLVVWVLWLYEPSPPGEGDSGSITDLLRSPAEKAVFWVFLSLEMATFVLWLLALKLYPLVAGRCEAPCALRWFWRVRLAQNRSGWHSYRPHGVICCCARRKHFQYDGARDSGGQPHGHGVWRDDSYHGEVLEGGWRRGVPVAPFTSRAFGNGAMSVGLRIGYGTVREDSLSGLSLWAQRPPDAALRFGAVGVECSVAGGFMAHLPQRLEHDEFSSGYALVRSLAQGPASQAAESFVSITSSRVGALSMGVYPLSTMRLMEPVPTLPVGSGTMALVFVHGYNCPIDWACMRLGQLVALSKLHPCILPLVFSWPCGSLPTYFDVLRQLDDFAADLPRFLQDVHDGGISEVHIVAHSMGCELVARAMPLLGGLVARPHHACSLLTSDCSGLHAHESSAASAGGHSVESNGGSRLRIPTVTFFNATCPEDAFTAPGGGLESCLRVCDRLTLYCDRDDIALRSVEVLGRTGRSIGRRVTPIDVPGTMDARRVDVVDCTSMDANVNNIRHSYFDLNVHVLGDFHELLMTRQPASRRSRLMRASAGRHDNVFAFLAPPVFVNW